MKPAILISALLLAACVQANSSKPSAQAEEPTEVIPPADNQVMCTMDAMQCADGSWVGRSGPNCEFVCPATTGK
jgi:hypothetical protein